MSNFGRIAAFVLTALVLAACGGGGSATSTGAGAGLVVQDAPQHAQVAVPSSIKVRPGDPIPPLARIKPSVLIASHGASRQDDYFWLAQRKDPEVKNYLEAENTYANKMMAGTAAMQDVLRSEVRAHIPPSAETPPFKMHGYWYTERFAHGANYFTLSRRKGSDGAPDEPVIDFNTMAAGYPVFALKNYETTPDGTLFGFSADVLGDRLHTIWFKDLASGTMLTDKIEFVAPDFVLAPDRKSVFYIRLQRGSLRSATVMRHVFGTDVKDDVEVYDERDETFDLSIKRSKGGQYLIITAEQTLTTEVRLLDLKNPGGTPNVIRARQRGVKYFADEVGGTLYLLTNREAPDYRVVRAGNGGTGAWTDVVPHTPGNFIRAFEVSSNFIAVEEWAMGQSRIRLGSFKAGKEHVAAVERGAYASFADRARFPGVRNLDPEATALRYASSSLISPTAIYDMNAASGQRVSVSRTVIAGYDLDLYELERDMAAAKDGQRVPLTLAYRKDKKRASGNPVLLKAYGAYGESYAAVFDEQLPSLLNRGFVVAVAHVRGGREMGQAWYEGGRMRAKTNTFTDFIWAAEHLVSSGTADPKFIFAKGRSAGGLIAGAVANMRPDLFLGIVADVPFVDVVTTMLDSGIPFTTSEYDEWGNPDEPGDYQHMLSYSPYDNVEAQNYPAMLVTAGFQDTQVGYYEPAKWVAKLRLTKTDDNPLLFRTNMDAGHAGGSGRFGRVGDLAFENAFLIDQVERVRAAKAKADKEAAEKKAKEDRSTLERVRDGLGL